MVIDSGTPSLSLTSAPIDSLLFDQWSETTHAAVRAHCIVYRRRTMFFAGRGGSIVVFGSACPSSVPEVLSRLHGTESPPYPREVSRASVGTKGHSCQLGRDRCRRQLSRSGVRCHSAGSGLWSAGSGSRGRARHRQRGRRSDNLLGSDSVRAITGDIDGGNWMVPGKIRNLSFKAEPPFSRVPAAAPVASVAGSYLRLSRKGRTS
jgi:hypothetical protein